MNNIYSVIQEILSKENRTKAGGSDWYKPTKQHKSNNVKQKKKAITF